MVVLARPGSQSIQSPLLEGAVIATVDCTDVTTLAAVLRDHNVDVVVSALAYGALPAQRPIADAAKEAGVKLFVPSEYGMPTEGGKEGHLAIKSDFAGEFATYFRLMTIVMHRLRLRQLPWNSYTAHLCT